MSITLDVTLTGRIADLVRQIEAVEQARPLIDAEVQGELSRLELLAARAEASSSPSLWQSANPAFSTNIFDDSVLTLLMQIAPDATRQLLAGRARRRGEQWRGLRMSEAEKVRRLSKLKNDLRQARARLEVHRRRIEAETNDVLPRVNDDPGVWLLNDDALHELAGTNAGRSK